MPASPRFPPACFPPERSCFPPAPPVGYLAIVAINQGFIALKCNEPASNFFMLNWCQTNMAEIESRATGTTFAEISKQNFRPIRAVLQPKELMASPPKSRRTTPKSPPTSTNPAPSPPCATRCCRSC